MSAEDDQELRAMAAIVEVLEPLDANPRARVLAWVRSRFGTDDDLGKPETARTTAAQQTRAAPRKPRGANTPRIRECVRQIGRPITVREIVMRTGLNATTVKSTLSRDAKEGVVVRNAHGLYSWPNADGSHGPAS
jgi:hypothetical protein